MRHPAWRYGALGMVVGAALLLASAPPPARSQAAAPALTATPARPVAAGTASVVSRVVAAQWRVAPERIRLGWIDPLSGAAAGDPVAVRPAGDAAGEEWLVTFAGGEHALRVRAGVLLAEPHAAHDIARGATLSAADITADSVVRWGAPPESPELAAAGWVARSSIVTGALLRAPAVTPPPAVHVGDTVRVVWRGAGVMASARGRAAATVAVGQPVAVRLDNGQRIEGRAQGAGRVLVP